MINNKLQTINLSKTVYVIILISFLMSALGFVISFVMPKTYRAESKIILTPSVKVDGRNIDEIFENSRIAVKIVSEKINTIMFNKNVLNNIGDNYEGKQIKRSSLLVKSTVIGQGFVLKIETFSDNPGKAVKMNQVALKQIKSNVYWDRILKIDDTKISILDYPNEDNLPFYPQPVLNAAIIFIGTILLGLIIIGVIYF